MATETLTLHTPNEVGRLLADRAKADRLLKGWKRETLAERAGVTCASLKRFESTGKASLELVLKVAHALGCLNEFEGLFRPPVALTMSELEKRSERRTRTRGRL